MIRQSVGGLAQRSCVFIKDAREARSWAGLIVAWSTRKTTIIFYSEHPATSIRLLSPHSANIDRAKFEQQCGGILARAQPDFARGMTIFERTERVPKKWNRFSLETNAKHLPGDQAQKI